MALPGLPVGAIEDHYELVVFLVMGLAPSPLFLVSPTLAMLPYFLGPLALFLFVARERIIKLGPLREGESEKRRTAQPAVVTKVSNALQAYRTREPRQAWVRLECWVIFVR